MLGGLLDEIGALLDDALASYMCVSITTWYSVALDCVSEYRMV